MLLLHTTAHAKNFSDISTSSILPCSLLEKMINEISTRSRCGRSRPPVVAEGDKGELRLRVVVRNPFPAMAALCARAGGACLVQTLRLHAL